MVTSFGLRRSASIQCEVVDSVLEALGFRAYPVGVALFL